MAEQQVQIIASREQSTMASAWTEYLCLSAVNGVRFRLYSAQYEPLAESETFFNEDTGEYDLPEVIDGKPVAGTEDEWVVGGVLEPFGSELVVEFIDVEDEKVSHWLAANQWSAQVTLDIIKGKLNQFEPDTPPAPELPKRFWKVRDAAVEHIVSNAPLPAALGDLQDWLAIDGWKDLLTAWINEDSALNLKDWAPHALTDSSLRDYEGLEETDVITDQMRIDYGRTAISDAIEQYDDFYSPSVFSFPIQRSDGKRAILGCTVEIQGQFGPFPMWHGVFADKDDFYNYLRLDGFVLHYEARDLSDADILCFWQVEVIKRKRSK